MAVSIQHNLQKKSGNAAWSGRRLSGGHRRLSGCLLAVGLAALVAAAQAQGLPDPTRPPAGFVDVEDARGGPGAANTPPAEVPDPEAGLVLQSVVLPKAGKPVAVIGGRYVPLGGRVDGWELTRISEREAVVVQGAERRVLKMTPLVTKTPIAAATPTSQVSTKKATVRAVKKTSKSKPTKVSCNDERQPK